MNIFAKIDSTQSRWERDCARVLSYLRENIQFDLICYHCSCQYSLDLLSLQLRWLEWKHNGAELSTTDIGLYNGAEFGQSSGFMLSIVKQLESPWNLATMCSKYFRYQYV